MRVYYGEEVAERLVRLTIDNLREAAEVCDQVEEVVRDFDGKIFNIKFEKALEEKTGKRFSVGRNYIMEDYIKQLSIRMSLDKRSVKSGEYSCEYVTDTDIPICKVYSDEKEKAPVIAKRIVAANIIPVIQEMKKEHLAEADKYEAAMTRISEWQNRHEDLKKEEKKLRDEIPYMIRDYYGMEFPI